MRRCISECVMDFSRPTPQEGQSRVSVQQLNGKEKCLDRSLPTKSGTLAPRFLSLGWSEMCSQAKGVSSALSSFFLCGSQPSGRGPSSAHREHHPHCRYLMSLPPWPDIPTLAAPGTFCNQGQNVRVGLEGKGMSSTPGLDLHGHIPTQPLLVEFFSIRLS